MIKNRLKMREESESRMATVLQTTGNIQHSIVMSRQLVECQLFFRVYKVRFCLVVL